MTVLLDTHAFLWFIAHDPRLGAQAQSLIQDPGNRRLLSMAGLWEMAIKVALGKLTLAQPFDQFIPRQLQLNQIEVLAIGLPHLAAVVAMPFHHRDPFDRLMAAQSLVPTRPSTLIPFAGFGREARDDTAIAAAIGGLEHHEVTSI